MNNKQKQDYVDRLIREDFPEETAWERFVDENYYFALVVLWTTVLIFTLLPLLFVLYVGISILQAIGLL